MSVIDDLTTLFTKFPGIGPRQGRRFVDHLLQQEQNVLGALAGKIVQLKKEVRRCEHCFRFYPPVENYQERCDICRDTTRDQSELMVVARETDLDSIECSHAYHGYYFVLGGLLALTASKPLGELRHRELIARVRIEISSGKLKEIILALSANTEGDHTIDYLKQELSPLCEPAGCAISILGRGLSTGTELEYSDSATIESALKNRA
ncbi:MAG: recombination protein RecR [Candidatus Vogelbacteria bacterium CG10_big_fil_rev_8_21_14_0_10_51_16]|uniref:Recombination protein RecR n=1 Tax=Candidatus Vogelbacteria bacterium CG10_big_fil_rev_8_21_14_0_10_51_16 TaxID=1975045 RepID=A0A2H0RE33_9BACT|nr:MAG: recombination protein RecR [Candidatus Vogelbacteria bacterium CG10_big_fil_rev_8_21_14_0_10_51_16]